MRHEMDLFVEWCSLRGSGTRAQFNAAYDDLGSLGLGLSAAQALSRIELMGVVEVDWEQTGRWAANPPALCMVEGAGGSAALVGARTTGTWDQVQALITEGVVRGAKAVDNGGQYPSTWYLAFDSAAAFDTAAKALGAAALTDVPGGHLEFYATLPEVLEKSVARFLPSGFQPRRLSASTLRFVEAEVRRDEWPPGCFEQRSRGRNVYLFIDDDGTRHVLDRWMAVHAELDRSRRHGVVVPRVLTWDPRLQRMANLASARLPTQWARAAMMATALPPERVTGGSWTDVYEGVKATVWKRMCDALRIPLADEDLSRFRRCDR